MEPNRRVSATKHKLTGENADSQEKKLTYHLPDYTPIRCIEVSNLPDNVSSEYIRGYFENTGPVENVVIERKIKDDKEELVAYVTFVLPEDAAQLICEENTGLRFRLSIKEAAEVYQPKVDPNILNFEGVVDDCLIHIMSYLDLIDVINLGRTSVRFQSVTKELYERKSHFTFGANTGDSSINEANLPVVLEDIGEYIRSIEWYGLNPTTLELLRKYCPNVTAMKFFSPAKALNSNHMKINKSFFAKVRRLDVHNAHFYDNALKSMIPTATIKSLTLENCRHLRGKFLPKRKTPNFKHLQVLNCNELIYVDSWTAIKNFIWINPLFTFAIDKCCSYLDCLQSPPEMLASFKVLQLDFSCFDESKLVSLNFSGLTQLTELKITRKRNEQSVVDIVEAFMNFDNLFAAIANISTLESLSIQKILITENTVKTLKLIKNLKKLKLNNVQNTIGKRLYTTLALELQNLNELSISTEVPEINSNWICDMIGALPNLRYFSHSSTTWLLVEKIVTIYLSQKQSILNIGIPKIMFDDPKKKLFEATSKGYVILSLIV